MASKWPPVAGDTSRPARAGMLAANDREKIAALCGLLALGMTGMAWAQVSPTDAKALAACNPRVAAFSGATSRRDALPIRFQARANYRPNCPSRVSISHAAQIPDARNNSSGFAVLVSFCGTAAWEKFIRCMTSSTIASAKPS